MLYMYFSLNFYEKLKFSVYFVLKPLEKVKNAIFRSQNGSKHAFSNLFGIPPIFELETFLKKTWLLVKFYIRYEVQNAIKVLPGFMVINAEHYTNKKWIIKSEI